LTSPVHFDASDDAEVLSSWRSPSNNHEVARAGA